MSYKKRYDSGSAEIKLGFITLYRLCDRKESGAHFWDSSFRDLNITPVKYLWIGSSSYGDQIITTDDKIFGKNGGVFTCGSDTAGPENNKYQPEYVLYHGPSVNDYLNTLDKYGDDFSVGPGAIDRDCAQAAEYKKLYRTLNPGIAW